MDIGVYSFLTLTEQEIGQFLDERKTFVLDDVSRIHMSEAVAFLEKTNSPWKNGVNQMCSIAVCDNVELLEMQLAP